MSDSRVRCSVYIRTPVEGGFRYNSVEISSPFGQTLLVTHHPPLVGDHMSLPTRVGTFVVVDRSWMHPAWGSVNWPYSENEPRLGPMLDLIVEATDALFADEVADSEGTEG